MISHLIIHRQKLRHVTWKYDFIFIILNTIFNHVTKQEIKIWVFFSFSSTFCKFPNQLLLLSIISFTFVSLVFCVYYVNWFQKCFGRRFLTPDGLTYFSSGCESVAVSKRTLTASFSRPVLQLIIWAFAFHDCFSTNK